MDIIKKGPIDPENALLPQHRAKLLETGYHEIETGYCQMPDGTGYVAVNNTFPGVSVEIIKWWFVWHSLEDIRYMLWFPKGHFGIRISESDRKIIENTSLSFEDRLYGITHFVIEDTGCGIEDISIRFLSPEDMGFDIEALKSSPVEFIAGANGLSVSRQSGIKSPAIMMHTVRETAEGVEFRSRFWLGYQFVDGNPVRLLPEGIKIPIDVMKGLAAHNVAEYSNLAAILPKLYSRFKNSI